MDWHGSPTAGDRVAAAEERGQHPALRDRRVLILVEQHDLVLVPLDQADLGHLLGQPGAERHLVAEVDEVPGALESAVLLDEHEQFGALQGHPRDHPVVGESARGTAAGRRKSVGHGLPGEAVGPIAQLLRLDDVLGEFGVEVDDLASERGDRALEVFEGPGRSADGACGEGVAVGVGEQPRGGFEAEAQAVLLDQAVGVRVVGGDARLAGVVFRGFVLRGRRPGGRGWTARARAARPRPCW